MKLVILDRDGVINYDSDAYIKSPEEWIDIPGSLEAISRLNHAGYRVFVATNQSGVGRGLFNLDTLHAIHKKMVTELQKFGGRLDAILYCPHTPDDDCNCRKPRAGLFNEIAERTHMNLDDAIVIGDAYRDLQAAQTVNAKAILVLTGKGKATYSQYKDVMVNIPCYEDLSSAVDAIIEQSQQNDS